MAQANLVDTVEARVPGLAMRIVLAMIAITSYLLLQDDLDPAPLVAARFGLGITLFALAIDLARGLAGAAEPVGREITPHQQRAEPLVDEAYRQVHQAVRAFIDHGRWMQAYAEMIDEAMDARGVPESQRESAKQAAQAAAQHRPPTYRPQAVAWIAGLLAVLGTTLVVGILLETLGAPTMPALVAIVGLGLYVLQVRGVRDGSRLSTGLAGLGGSALVLLSGLALDTAQGGAWWLITAGWWLITAGGGTLALGTVGLLILHPFHRPSWQEVQAELEEELVTLRRAFLATLVAGLVLFPFKPLLDALFEALGWAIAGPYRMAVVGYVTVATFLALELASAWYALNRGRSREARLRQQRIEANEAILSLIEGDTTPTGGHR